MSISADIKKFDYNEKDGNIYYFIKVFYNGREWAIRKRYSEFVQFNDTLRLRYGISMYIIMYHVIFMFHYFVY